jgi:hypothetical protein
MGDLSPVGVVDSNDADAAAARGGGVFRVPEIADWCVAAVPVGNSGAAVAVDVGEGAASDDGFGGAGDAAIGSAEFFGVVVDDRRQRLKNPNMHFPENHERRSTSITPFGTQKVLYK